MKKVLALLLLSALFAVSANAQFESYVETAKKDGIILGDEYGNVNAEKLVTRGEFAVILTKFLNLSGGVNTFSDVTPHDWFAGAMAAANHHSLIVGDEYGNAKPYDNITRQDAVCVIGRYYGAKSQNFDLSQDVSDYAKEYWAYAVANGLLAKDVPHEHITKGEILALLYDYDEKDDSVVRFRPGYPKISQEYGVFGHINIEVCTNRPAKIYYVAVEENLPHPEINIPLCETTDDVITASIKVDMGKNYDIYLLAIDNDGISSRISVINGARAFAIDSGDGSKSSPFMINTQEQLAQISLISDKFYRLGQDILLDKNWVPVSNFTGVLDGNGYTISGLHLSDKNHAGLISNMTGTVRNLTVYGDIQAGKVAGIIAGENSGTIENCVAAGTISVNTDYAGGICGKNYGTVKNCLSSLYSITSGSFAGGICGGNFGVLQDCLAASNVVVSDMYAGGIAGVNNGGTIEKCVSACMTVHDVLTLNSGRITTNKNDGFLDINYFYLGAIYDDFYEEPSDYSQNGYDASWENLRDLDFYKSLGWDTSKWRLSSNGFRLIYPRSADAPILNPGETIYFPKPIKTAEGLRNIDKNPSGHYILASDIHMTLPWKIICATDGFSGTFDGDGHTIYDLNLNTQSGFFSNITGGTIKNLTLKNVTSAADGVSGILTACNYGYIDNCKIYGKIQTRKAGHIGSFAGLNHGAITNCDAYVDIINTNSNSTVGGISAESDGVIFGTTYHGKIEADGENTVIGGIVGYETGGYVSDCYAYMTLSATPKFGYIGGVCGMAEGSQIYKCASGGNIVSDAENIIYAGGICALIQNATLYNCYSLSEIHAFAKNGYVGGICGCNSGSIIQNTYSAANIFSGENVIVGGICGFSEIGFIMQNVALNPAINGGKNIGAVFGGSDISEIMDNYSCERTRINSQLIASSEKNGTVKNIETLKNIDFFLTPLSEDGVLGWPSIDLGDDVWQKGEGSYPFPVLSGVKSQATKTPIYK
ncbi:MAG: S-layer homology domain-containing protein [Clostridia bacterium]|nr:S-layer homology domain-containing protein [Clostridia bacterium]